MFFLPLAPSSLVRKNLWAFLFLARKETKPDMAADRKAKKGPVPRIPGSPEMSGEVFSFAACITMARKKTSHNRYFPKPRHKAAFQMVINGTNPLLWPLSNIEPLWRGNTSASDVPL